MTYLIQMDTTALDAALFRARPRHAEHENVSAETNLAMKTICSIRNASVFFTQQKSQDGPIVKWLLDLRERGKGHGNGLDDDEGHGQRPQQTTQA